MTFLVYIISITQECKTKSVCKSKQECTAKPTLFSPPGSLYVGNIAIAVFVLKVYVHYIFLWINLVAQGTATVALHFINLNLIHRIIRQILQKNLAITAKEGTRA